jgi:6-phosphofructokinase 1
MSYLYASKVDRDDAEKVGRAAVRAALAGETDRMVTIRRLADSPYASETGLCPLEAIANRERRLPDEFLTADGVGVTDAFRRYALPLLGETLPDYLHL